MKGGVDEMCLVLLVVHMQWRINLMARTFCRKLKAASSKPGIVNTRALPLSFSRARRIILCFIVSLYSVSLWAENLEQISVDNPKKASTQIKILFSSMPKYHQFVLKNPSRIVFDFSNLTIKTSLKNVATQSELLQSLRFAQRGKNNVRLVLDVSKGLQVSTKKTVEKGKAGLILNLSMATKPEKVAEDEALIPDVLLPFLKNHEAKAKQKMQSTYRDVVVVIDPGHGGKDPGASGSRRTLEKNVVLQIGRKLKAMVNKTRGMKAYLTRKGDYYVGLRQRLAIARKYKADIFVSIHADAFLNRRSRGASVYSLSQRGATSEAARWLAASENYSELGGVDLSDLDDDNGMIRSVLIDLSQTATVSASLTLGKAVLNGLNTIATLHHDDVEQAR